MFESRLDLFKLFVSSPELLSDVLGAAAGHVDPGLGEEGAAGEEGGERGEEQDDRQGDEGWS